MNKKPDLLSIVTGPDGDVVKIHADLSGLVKLRDSIDYMIKKLEEGECDHDHFRSEDWAGNELTTSMLSEEQEKGCKQVHHLKIYAWNEKWKSNSEL